MTAWRCRCNRTLLCAVLVLMAFSAGTPACQAQLLQGSNFVLVLQSLSATELQAVQPLLARLSRSQILSLLDAPVPAIRQVFCGLLPTLRFCPKPQQPPAPTLPPNQAHVPAPAGPAPQPLSPAPAPGPIAAGHCKMVNFDELPSGQDFAQDLPEPYLGLNWSGMQYFGQSSIAPGLQVSVTSAPNAVAVNQLSPEPQGAIESAADGATFELISLDITAAFSPDVTVTITGYLGIEKAGEAVVDVTSASPRHVSLDFGPTDTLLISSVSNVDGVTGVFLLDTLCFASLPI